MGTRVGCGVGADDGSGDGSAEGVAEGSDVGDPLGRGDGRDDGAGVGATEGDAVGVGVGSGEGIEDGRGVGAAVGDRVGYLRPLPSVGGATEMASTTMIAPAASSFSAASRLPSVAALFRAPSTKSRNSFAVLNPRPDNDPRIVSDTVTVKWCSSARRR